MVSRPTKTARIAVVGTAGDIAFAVANVINGLVMKLWSPRDRWRGMSDRNSAQGDQDTEKAHDCEC